LANISGGRGQFPATPIGVERIETVLYVVTIHASDRQAGRWTELRQQYCALHYMQWHGKNWSLTADENQ